MLSVRDDVLNDRLSASTGSIKFVLPFPQPQAVKINARAIRAGARGDCVPVAGVDMYFFMIDPLACW
jgi:hypothetical protein